MSECIAPSTNTDEYYVLKMDKKNLFSSIDRSTIKEIIEKHNKNPELAYILEGMTNTELAYILERIMNNGK